MPNPHVEQLRAIGVEPARQYLWEVSMGVPPGGALALGGLRDSKQITFRAMSTSLPDNVTEEYVLNYKSAKVKFAGRDNSAKTFDINFWDGEDFQIWKGMYGWAMFCKVNPKLAYAQTVGMKLLSRVNDTVLFTLNLVGAWPGSVQPVPLDYASNDIITIPCTFHYDDFELA